MKKGRTSELFEIPAEIIQHIQSFLSSTDAAQTRFLSKSWYTAWSTRPNLDFDDPSFTTAKKILQRYKELKLNIQSLRLGMCRPDQSVADELILKAIELRCTDLAFEFPRRGSPLTFILPDEALGSETLANLSVIGSCIMEFGNSIGQVTRTKLKSLYLFGVVMSGDSFRDLMSKCPLIETLILCSTENSRNPLFSCSPINLHEFDKLKYLYVEYVRIQNTFNEYLSKFPNLKELAIQNCYGYKKIQIASQSVERVRFAEKNRVKAAFSLPNIQKFQFEGNPLSCPSFEKSNRKFESDISLYFDEDSGKVFYSLNKLLEKLRLSKICLSIYFKCRFNATLGHSASGRVKASPIPVVESVDFLRIGELNLAVAPFIDGIFLSFRPRLIILYWFPFELSHEHNYLVQLLCTKLVHESSGERCIPNTSKIGMQDLEEVGVEVFEESGAGWLCLPWKSLLDEKAYPLKERTIRFHLKWAACK